MYLSNEDILGLLRQGKEFIFIRSAELELDRNKIYSGVVIPEAWENPCVSPFIVVEAMGQTSELCIRKAYGIHNVTYLVQIKELNFYQWTTSTEEFMKIRVISEILENINQCFMSQVNAYLNSTCICSAELYHYVKN